MADRGTATTRLYRLRCRLGAWLLREHVVAALCEHYNEVGLFARAKGDAPRKERVDYIGIGLRHAIGQGLAWRRFDSPETRLMHEARVTMEHAKDAL